MIQGNDDLSAVEATWPRWGREEGDSNEKLTSSGVGSRTRLWVWAGSLGAEFNPNTVVEFLRAQGSLV